MDKRIVKNKILEFLNKHKLAVISTIHSNKDAPESAVVGFANTDSLEIIFGTSCKTRKHANIQANPNVSVVIGWDSAIGTLQYEGVASVLGKDELKEYTAILVAKNIENKKYISFEDQRYILIKPTWIRFTDNLGNPPDIYEINFEL